MQKIWFIHKKQKTQETKDERYISRYIITIELEHSNDHWQRSSIEREKDMENSNIYRSTDRGRNAIWSLIHYITVFVINHNFVKKEEEKEAEWHSRWVPLPPQGPYCEVLLGSQGLLR